MSLTKFLLTLTFVTGVGGSGLLRRAAAQNPTAFVKTYVMDWHGCTARGECLPAFYPIPAGRVQLLRCSPAGVCLLSPYIEWDLDDDRGFTWRHRPEVP